MRATTGAALAVVALVTAGTALTATASAAPNIGCGSVVRTNVTLRNDITGCAGDGLVVGANGIRIDLNGHDLSGLKTPGSVGVRNAGHNGVRIESSKPFGAINEFDVGVLISDAARNSVVRVLTRSVRFGIRLEHTDGALLAQNDVGFAELVPSCDPASAPAAIVLSRSSGAILRDNFAQLSGFGILLVRSHHNIVRGNGAAPDFSDGNVCTGIALFDADQNTVAGNTAANNRSGPGQPSDGIFVDAASSGTVVKENLATLNTDDGIDVDSPGTKIVRNAANSNDDLGIEAVPGTNASGNTATGNGNPIQCLNVACS
jgi:parallel beta-helix repeat protein